MKRESWGGLGIVLLLAACTTTPDPSVREVRILVPVACRDARAAPSIYPDTFAAIQTVVGTDALVGLLLAGRELRITREAENEGQIHACRPPDPG